jgi:hypothetical protein
MIGLFQHYIEFCTAIFLLFILLIAIIRWFEVSIFMFHILSSILLPEICLLEFPLFINLLLLLFLFTVIISLNVLTNLIIFLFRFCAVWYHFWRLTRNLTGMLWLRLLKTFLIVIRTAFLWVVDYHLIIILYRLVLAFTQLVNNADILFIFKTIYHLLHNLNKCNIITALILHHFADMSLYILNTLSEILCHQLAKWIALLK